MEKISIGTHEGNERFVQRTGYFHDEKNKTVEIYYDEFCETSTGARFFVEDKTHVVIDIAEETAQDVDNETKEIIQKIVVEANPAYTNLIAKYKTETDSIGLGIDNFLIQSYKK